MQIVHRALLRVCAPCRALLQPESGVHVAHSHQLLQHRESWKERCNHRREGEALHRADLPESLPLSWQLLLAYPMGEVGDGVRR